MAAALRFTPQTIYRLYKRGKLEGVTKVGNRWRMNRETLEGWVKGQADGE